MRYVVEEDTFSFNRPDTLTLDAKPVGELLHTAKLRSEKVEDVPIQSVRFESNGTLDNGMGFSEEGFNRVLKTVGLPRRVVDNLMQTGGRRIAVEAIGHMMRESPAELHLTTMDGVVEGCVDVTNRPIAGHDALTRLMEAVENASLPIEALRVARARFVGLHLDVSLVSDAPDRLQLPGDAIRAGVELSHSEGGGIDGRVAGFLFRLICTNGAIAKMGEEGGSLTRGSGADEQLRKRIEEAVDASMNLLGKVIPASQVEIDKASAHHHFLKMSERFGATHANRALEHAAHEASRWKRPFTSAYDVWNGVTDAAKSAPSPTRRWAMESYSAEVLDWGAQRFARLNKN